MGIRQVYQTTDGKLFEAQWAAMEHEAQYTALEREISKILSPLGNRVSSGARRHDLSVVRKARQELIYLARRKYSKSSDSIWEKITPDTFHHGDYQSSETTEKPFRDAWYRLGCIDDNGDEFNQLFFTVGFAKYEDKEHERNSPLKLDSKLY
jgi:hypothetical protein